MEDQDLRGGGWVLTDTPTMSYRARFSALHHAALGGSLELIALLLEAQATVDIKDSNGETLMCLPRSPCGHSLLPLHCSNADNVGIAALGLRML